MAQSLWDLLVCNFICFFHSIHAIGKMSCTQNAPNPMDGMGIFCGTLRIRKPLKNGYFEDPKTSLPNIGSNLSIGGSKHSWGLFLFLSSWSNSGDHEGRFLDVPGRKLGSKVRINGL